MFIYIRAFDAGTTQTHAIEVDQVSSIDKVCDAISNAMGYGDGAVQSLRRVSATKNDPPPKEVCIDTDIPDSPYHRNPHPFCFVTDDDLGMVSDVEDLKITHTYEVVYAPCPSSVDETTDCESISSK